MENLIQRVRKIWGEMLGFEPDVCVSFVSEAEIRRLNKEYRGLDEPTDILSFPLAQTKEELENLKKEGLPLGDLVICPSEAKKIFGQADERTLCLLLHHGFLHLIGFDHDTEANEAKMWELQEDMSARVLL